MKRKKYIVLEILLVSFCCFLIYFIVSMSLDYLFGNEFSLKNTLASSAVFALLWAFISGYKIAKRGYYFKCFSHKECNKSPKL